MRNVVAAALLVVLIVIVVVVGVRGRASKPTPTASLPVPVSTSGDTSGAVAADFSTYRIESMATTIEVMVPAGDVGAAGAEDVFAICREVDEMMNEWKEGSPLSAVNRAAGEDAVSVPKPLFDLLTRAVAIADMTGGTFDPTWAAVWDLWDFKDPDPQVPDSVEVDERLELIDYRLVNLNPDGDEVWLHEPGMLLGLGGIAKGYALDRARDALEARGIQNFLVKTGGQVLVRGLKNGRPWRVGIQDPRGARDDFFATLEVTNVSVSTSGDYENFFIKDGKRYHHIIDTRTGWPAEGTRSVTLIAKDATLADALTKAVFVMGPEIGLDFIESYSGVDAVIVDTTGTVTMTEGARTILTMNHPPLNGL